MSRASDIGFRAVIALLLIAVGYLSVVRSFAIVWAKTDAVSASTLVPSDARITAKAAWTIMERSHSAASRRDAMRLAHKALGRDATAVPAVVVLGLYSGVVDEAKISDAWFEYSQALSRRDLPTQLYFIENAVAAGDVTEALRHYDTAFRVSESIRSTLYPILESAVADAPVRTALARTLASKPLWAEGFMEDIVGRGPDFPAAAQLFVDVRRLNGAIPPDTEAALLSNLISRRDVISAWRYYVSTRPAAAHVIVRNQTFDPRRVGNTPFDWQISSANGVIADLDTDDRGGVLDYRLPPTVAAVVVQQMIVAPAGRYRLGSVVEAVSQSLGSGPYWDLKCSDGRSIGRLEIGGPISNRRKFSADLNIPPDCNAQILSLMVRSSDDIQGASGRIAAVTLDNVN